MRSILIVFVLIFWAWPPASAEDARQLTTPDREKLGVSIRQINDETAHILGVQPPRGAIVTYVIEKSPAKRAGIMSGDVIVKLNNIDTNEAQDVMRVMADVPVKKSIPIVLIREGREIVATVMFDTIARVRTPTCEELFSYANSMPPDAIDRSFGKRNGDLSASDFDDALAIVSRCREAASPPPLDRRHVPTERNGQFQLFALSNLAQGLESRKSEALRRERVLINRSEAELNSRLAERKKQIDAQIKADQAAADAKKRAEEEAAKAEECRLQCRQKLTAMLTELRSLGTDQASYQRLWELGREQQTLFASMPMDVQASLTALNKTFASEFGEHETVAEKARLKLIKERQHATEIADEIAKHEEELKIIYLTYLMLDFCAKRFPNFSEGKDTARDVAKNKEAVLAAEQINRSWNTSAEAFAKIQPLLQTTNQLYAECSGANNTLMGLIMSGVAEPGRGRLRKKDF